MDVAQGREGKYGEIVAMEHAVACAERAGGFPSGSNMDTVSRPEDEEPKSQECSVSSSLSLFFLPPSEAGALRRGYRACRGRCRQ